MNTQLNAHEWLSGQHRTAPQPKPHVRIPAGASERIIDAMCSELSADHMRQCSLAVKGYANNCKLLTKLGLSLSNHVEQELALKGVTLPQELMTVLEAEQSTFDYLASEKMI